MKFILFFGIGFQNCIAIKGLSLPVIQNRAIRSGIEPPNPAVTFEELSGHWTLNINVRMVYRFLGYFEIAQKMA